MTDLFDEDRLIAAVDAVGRAGAREFEVGYLDDDVPMHLARWWASATWNGTKVHVENHKGPDAAGDALARKLLNGGRCTHCDGTIRLDTVTMRRGTRVCRWTRTGARWNRGCDVPEGERIITLPPGYRHGDVPR